ncbi:MAG: MATE family efflux transporter [Clostridia bacterium]|nr:MATE family efflux transporter [Clostridia bacterium]
MKKQTADLTHGNLPKQILFFSLPLIASNLLQVLFHMSDLAVVGRFSADGANALGSVGSTATLVTLFTGFLMGMGCGVNVLVAKFFGACDRDNVRRTVHTSAIVCTLIGLVILLIGVTLARPLLRLLGTHPDLLDGAILYLRIYFLGMPALAIYNYGHGVLSAVGDTKRPLLYMLAAGILNIVLNLLFVIGFGMSIDGVAWASVISQYLSAVLTLSALFRARDVHGLNLRELRIDLDMARLVLRMSIPAGLQNALFQVANLFIQASVNSLGNATLINGNSAAANSDALIFDVMAAFYTACSSFIGQNFGAGNRDRIKKSYFICLAYSFGIAAIMSGSLVLFGRQFLSLFTTSQAVIDAGMTRLVIMGLSYPFSAFMDCTISASRGLGKTGAPTLIVMLGSGVFRLVWLVTVFLYFRTIESIYLLYIFSWTVTAIAEIVYFRRIYKKTALAL